MGQKAGREGGQGTDYLALREALPGAEESHLEQLLKECSPVRFKARQTLFMKGDPSPCAYLLLSGRIYIYADAASGQRIILNVIMPGELYGEIGIVDDGYRSAHAEAATSGAALQIPGASLKRLMEACPQVRAWMMQLIASRLRNTTEQMEDASLHDVTQRLARLVMRLKKQAANGNCFTLPFSQSDLAELTATTRETVNRQLNDWRRHGVLTLQGKQVEILDEARLAQICDEDGG